MFLDQQIAISEWFLKDNVPLKIMLRKFRFAITEINDILKYIQREIVIK